MCISVECKVLAMDLVTKGRMKALQKTKICRSHETRKFFLFFHIFCWLFQSKDIRRQTAIKHVITVYEGNTENIDQHIH